MSRQIPYIESNRKLTALWHDLKVCRDDMDTRAERQLLNRMISEVESAIRANARIIARAHGVEGYQAGPVLRMLAEVYGGGL